MKRESSSILGVDEISHAEFRNELQIYLRLDGKPESTKAYL